MSEGSALSSFGINPIYLIGQIINFAILFFVLKKLLYKPILEKLRERSSEIKKGLKAAEENIRLQKEMEIKIEEQLNNTYAKIEKMILEAEKEAGIVKKNIISSAKLEAEILMKKKQTEIEDILKKKEKELQEKIIDIATMITRKTLAQYLDKKTHDIIINSQIQKLSQLEINK